MKRTLVIGLLAMTMLAITGCGESAEEKETTTESKVKETSADTTAAEKGITAGGWTVEFEDTLVDKSLENASTVLGYGEVETANFSKEASAGKQFCLIKLKCKKEEGTENIDWTKMVLKDAEGNSYSRIEDGFISDLGMKRLPGTNLNFGENEGWICFEINEGASGLTLEYPFETETLTIQISE